ncbi:MAG: hypothetical protein R3B93_21825 [Bacteroidia bacterium]
MENSDKTFFSSIHILSSILSLGTILFLTFPLSAQNTEKGLKQNIPQNKRPITLDGNLDEASWQDAESTDSFWQFFPTDSMQAKHQTYVKIIYDDNAFMLGFMRMRLMEIMSSLRSNAILGVQPMTMYL